MLKKVCIMSLSTLMMLAAPMSTAEVALAVETTAAESIKTKGTLGTCKWDIDEGGVLTIHAGEATLNINDRKTNIPWNNNLNSITAVKVDGNVKLSGNVQYLFSNLNVCQSIDLTGMTIAADATGVEKMFDGTACMNGKTYKDAKANKELNIKTTHIKAKSFARIAAADLYTLTYDANGGSISQASKSVTSDSAYGTLATPTRTGYTFAGWYTAANGGTQVTASTICKGDATIYAHWKANSYTVTCEDWLVDANNNRKVKLGSSTKSMPYGTTANGTEWGESTTVGMYHDGFTYKSATTATVGTSGTTVYRYFWAYPDLNGLLDGNRVWNINGFGTADVYINGTQVANDVSDYYTAYPYGTTYEFKDIKPAAGKTYDGLESGSLKGTITGATDTHLKFHTNAYTISYALNGGSVLGNPTSYNEASPLIVLKNPALLGYTFSGWTGSNGIMPQKSTDLTGTSLDGYTMDHPYTAALRDHILGDEFSVTAGKTYRVMVTAKRTTGDLDLQGGLWYTSQTSGTSYDYWWGEFTKLMDVSNGYAVYYKDVTVPAGKTKAKFYIQIEQDFSGGSTQWSACDMHVFDLESAVKIPTGSTGDKSYTANWIANAYPIVLDANGGHMMATDNDSIVSEDKTTETFTVTYNLGYFCYRSIPVRTGYTFMGYFSEKNGKGEKVWNNGLHDGYNVACAVKSTYWSDDASKGKWRYPAGGTFYAGWKANDYSVKFDANGGSGTMDNESMTYDTAKDLTSNSFTHAGYTFAGWNTKADGTGTAYADKASVKNLTESGTVTLYAQWTPTITTVTFDPQGGTNHLDGGTNTLKLGYDYTSYYVQHVPVRKGYTFDGYYTGKNGTGVKVYGKGIDTDIHAGDSTVYMLANPVDGYWKKTGTTMCIWQNTNAQLALYANWIPNTYTVSIPTSISYSGMKTGKVNMSDSYDVIVKNETGSFGDTVVVQASNSVLSAENGSTEKLNVTTGSASSALTFTANGTKKDNVTITGTARTADKWTGLIQYTVSIK